MSLAAQMTEWLDTHPGVLKAVNDEPELLNIVTRYADELKPFLSRYVENLSKKPAGAAESAPASAPATIPAESVDLQAKIDALAAQAGADKDQIAKLTGELAGTQRLHEQALESVKTQTARADAAEAKLKTADDALKLASTERDEAQQKLAAIESGAAPVSATPAPESKKQSSMWEDARKGKK